MTEKALLMQSEVIENKILLLRGKKVMFDRDLAVLYGVTTGNLNKAVSRNIERSRKTSCSFLQRKSMIL